MKKSSIIKSVYHRENLPDEYEVPEFISSQYPKSMRPERHGFIWISTFPNNKINRSNLWNG